MGNEIFTDNAKFTPYWWDEAPRPEIGSEGIPNYVDVAVSYTHLRAHAT